MAKVALVTGASSGIGKMIAQELKSAGFRVYAAARRVDRMADLEKEGIVPIALDLTEDESIAACVNSILSAEKHIDVLVNNAGYGSYGTIEDVPMEEARRRFDGNLFGTARLIQLAVPAMRENHAGKIVSISLMGGKIWMKFGGWYHATKYAVEGLSDCLRMEPNPFGIDVIVAEPGGVKTDWGIIAANNLKKTLADGMIRNYSRNESMWAFFEPELNRRLSMLETDDRCAARVRSALMELLPGGECTIDDAVRKLGTFRRGIPAAFICRGDGACAVFGSRLKADPGQHFGV